jgi:2-oxoglutarate ferredoxin oxidoreductase subunit beta
VFNDKAFADFTESDVRDEQNVFMEHGKPLIFGKAKDKGLRLKNNFDVEVVKMGDGVNPESLIIHDEHSPHPSYAFLMSRLSPPEFPVPIGVFRDVRTSTFEERIHEQIAEAQAKLGQGDLKKLVYSGDTWDIQ